MRRIIIRAALITLAVLIGVAALIFGAGMLFLPDKMATASERIGNYSFATTCADLKYSYTKKTEDLARCAEDSILAGKDELIVSYCEKLVAKNDFRELCEKKDKLYGQTAYGDIAVDYGSYIISNYSVALYRRGDFDKALTVAKSGNERCFIKLVIAVADKGTSEQHKKLKTELGKLEQTELIVSLTNLL